MKLPLKIFFIPALLIVLSACSNEKKEVNRNDSAQKEVENSVENTYPKGYPVELTLPEGISPKDIETGTGRNPTPGGVNDKVFNVYVIYKKHPKNYKDIINHYKKLLTKENHWQGDWETNNPNQLYGSFKKDNMHVAVEINRDYFSLKIEVYDKIIS